MDKYNLKEIKSKQMFKKQIKTFQLHKKNKTEITPDEIKLIYNSMMDKAPKGSQFRIRGLGVDKFNTISYGMLKNLNDDNIEIYSEEEYLNNKAKDTGKFQKYSQLEFTIIK